MSGVLAAPHLRLLRFEGVQDELPNRVRISSGAFRDSNDEKPEAGLLHFGPSSNVTVWEHKWANRRVLPRVMPDYFILRKSIFSRAILRTASILPPNIRVSSVFFFGESVSKGYACARQFWTLPPFTFRAFVSICFGGVEDFAPLCYRQSYCFRIHGFVSLFGYVIPQLRQTKLCFVAIMCEDDPQPI